MCSLMINTAAAAPVPSCPKISLPAGLEGIMGTSNQAEREQWANLYKLDKLQSLHF